MAGCVLASAGHRAAVDPAEGSLASDAGVGGELDQADLVFSDGRTHVSYSGDLQGGCKVRDNIRDNIRALRLQHVDDPVQVGASLLEPHRERRAVGPRGLAAVAEDLGEQRELVGRDAIASSLESAGKVGHDYQRRPSTSDNTGEVDVMRRTRRSSASPRRRNFRS